ncbi:Homeobox protein Rhox13 [Apodemus speciosus]|uniref:Homeobox protein Rhox13 n=1 Tax=Apodemus speciosus TaxID=105296 RepID=A0ABQ0FU13_APOSI
MAHGVSFNHSYDVVGCEEETNAGAQEDAMASTSTELAPGAMAVAQAGVAGSSHGCASLCDLNVQGYSRQESESDPEESDDYEDEDWSISDLDTSDPEPEEAAPSVAAAGLPTAPVAAAIQIPGPHRSRPRRRRRRTPFHFTEWQVEEMETLFEETQYPDVLTRGRACKNFECARSQSEGLKVLNVIGKQQTATKQTSAANWLAELKEDRRVFLANPFDVWFINRRAKQRKNERRAMLRNMPPGAEDFIFLADVEEPS